MPTLDANEIMFDAFEPKVQNRFIMYIDGIPSYLVKTANAPQFSDSPITLHHINTYRRLRGKRDWQNMQVTLYDPITPSGTQAVMEWARAGYESVTGRANYSDLYKKDVTFNVLGPVGDIVGEWILKGAFVESSNFGSYDWSSAEAVSIDMTLAFDYAVLNF